MGILVGLPSCDVSLVVGYGDTDLPISPASCPDDAVFRACATEPCVVSEIVAAQRGKETLALDSEFIYFIRETDVLARVPKGGGTVVDLADVGFNLQRIALDEENVYWTNYDGEILRVAKSGGPAATVTKILGNPVSIASHEGDLYVAMTESGEIVKVTKSDGATTLLAGQNGPVDLGKDGSHVYWINQGQSGMANGELVRAPLGDLSGAEVVVDNLEEPLALGIAGDAILWATYDKVSRLPRSGGEPRVYEVPFGEPKGVTEFDGILYVVGAGGLFRVRADNGDTQTLDARGFTGLALVCDGLYAVGWFESVLVRYSQ